MKVIFFNTQAYSTECCYGKNREMWLGWNFQDENWKAADGNILSYDTMQDWCVVTNV